MAVAAQPKLVTHIHDEATQSLETLSCAAEMTAFSCYPPRARCETTAGQMLRNRSCVSGQK